MSTSLIVLAGKRKLVHRQICEITRLCLSCPLNVRTELY